MAFGLVVTSAWLVENEVVKPEDLAVGTRSDAVHGARFQIHENSMRNIAIATCFIGSLEL